MKKISLLVILLTGHFLSAQVGIGTEHPSPSSQLDINATNRGVLIPQVALTGLSDMTTITAGNVNSLLVYNTSTDNSLSPGYYYWFEGEWKRLNTDTDLPDLVANNGLSIDQNTSAVQLGGNLNNATTITTSASNTLAIGGLVKAAYNNDIVGIDKASGVLKQMKAAMPTFLYMPSIALPTAGTHIVSGEGFSVTAGVFSVSLYARYLEQFGAPEISNPTRTTTLPVLAANEMDYYITGYDKTVFENITITDSGILSYKVKANAVISSRTFMNIVFAVKP